MDIGRIFVLLTILSMIEMANAATITVDDSGGADYTKIQDAINAAYPGDIIEVYSGTYHENLSPEMGDWDHDGEIEISDTYENINISKRLTLTGVDTGTGMPIIDPSNSSVRIKIFKVLVDNVDIRNFVIIGNHDISNWGSRTWGIVVTANNVDISNNYILNNTVAIDITSDGSYYSSGNIISNNNLIDNMLGIHIQYTHHNIISDNYISGINHGTSYQELGSSRGIHLSDGYNNTIKRNHILNNNWGIRLYYSKDNIIYDNYFNNIIDLDDYSCIFLPSCANIWNTTKISGANIIEGSFIGGNYWTRPDGIGFSQTCTDRGDGFCNSDYVLDSNNIDYLPLTNSSLICGNTPSGQNIEINPSSNIDIMYDNVVQCGNTSVITYSINQWASLPNSYIGISFNDIQTTATYSNGITVNITYSDSDISGMDENSIKMYHYENGNWIDTTTSLDMMSNKITGTVNSLSPFAIVGSVSGTITPTVSPTTTPIPGNIVRGPSSNVFGIMILTICLILVSILMIRKR